MVIARKVISCCAMPKSSSVPRRESCFKVVECIYHQVFISRKVVFKLWNVYIIMYSLQGKLLRVAQCLNHQVFLAGKVVLKLRDVYIIKCSSQEKLFLSCGMYISSSVHRKENFFKNCGMYESSIKCSPQGKSF